MYFEIKNEIHTDVVVTYNILIMETVWGLLSNKIYENVQYRRLDDLWQAMVSAVADFNENNINTIFKLYNSIPDRIEILF